MASRQSNRLAEVAPELAKALARSLILTPAAFSVAAIRCVTQMIAMRDGVRLATDLYLPPKLPAPAIAYRTPYGRALDAYVGAFLSLSRRGYVVVAQDVRGTGDSEPGTWDYYMYEPEDGYDLVEWVGRQDWFDGFLGACGGSYVGQTQWQMAMHPSMSTIVPDVSGLGVAVNTANIHMLANAYARSIGKGKDKVAVPIVELERQMLNETLATGYFNEPLLEHLPQAVLDSYPQLRHTGLPAAQSWLWEHYCSSSCRERAELVRRALGTQSITMVEIEALRAVFGHRISHDRHTLPHPQLAELCKSLHAPVLLRSGWYDWGLNDALATWQLLMRSGSESVRSRSRLFIGPNAHNMPGYHEGTAAHPELHYTYNATTNVELLLRWYAAVREGKLDAWPRIIYYLMGANEWRVADTWPVSGSRSMTLYLGSRGSLHAHIPEVSSQADCYTYDPTDPTPTVGGSIVSFVYPPGSVDVAQVQQRADVLSYTTEPLEKNLDVVGPLRVVLFASSSAVDTDFCARLSDVFPDGRAVQLQNGILRARYRNRDAEPELLEPGRIYRLEIDLWATANRFKAGHRLRLDISSADFPRFDRNSNLGGERAVPRPALQRIYHDPPHPSHLSVSVVDEWEPAGV